MVLIHCLILLFFDHIVADGAACNDPRKNLKKTITTHKININICYIKDT